MPKTNKLSRSLHDAGLAAWFGGSLFGAAALNRASDEVAAPAERLRVANAGWSAWVPWNAAAIGAHLTGAVAVTFGNKSRIAGQQGVASTATAKAGLTAAALAATAYARVLGKKLEEYEESQTRAAFGAAQVEDATTPSPQTPPEIAEAQRTLAKLQWAIPALTGAALVVNVIMGEQQRPLSVAKGFIGRLS
jgi:hypothetical protein